MEVTINWGARGAKKTFKVVASDAPGDLVFQSLIKRGPMLDHNVLSRHIKPAARKLGIGWVNWRYCGAPMRPGWSKLALIRKRCRRKCDTAVRQPPWISMRNSCRQHSAVQSRR